MSVLHRSRRPVSDFESDTGRRHLAGAGPAKVSDSKSDTRPTILTRAEVAPCTCPEHCERDHEQD